MSHGCDGGTALKTRYYSKWEGRGREWRVTSRGCVLCFLMISARPRLRVFLLKKWSGWFKHFRQNLLYHWRTSSHNPYHHVVVPLRARPGHFGCDQGSPLRCSLFIYGRSTGTSYKLHLCTKYLYGRGVSSTYKQVFGRSFCSHALLGKAVCIAAIRCQPSFSSCSLFIIYDYRDGRSVSNL